MAGLGVSGLCADCAGIDWDAAFKRPPKTDPQSMNLARAGRSPNWWPTTAYSPRLKSDACPLCCFLIPLCPGSVRVRFSSEVEIVERPTSFDLRRHTILSAMLKPVRRQFKPPDDPPCDVMVLGIGDSHSSWNESHNFIGLLHDSEPPDMWKRWFVREIDSMFADYVSIKHWLEFCHSSHSQCLPPNPRPHAHSKLIDCQTEQVVRALPEYEYVALSYVWGKMPNNNFWTDVHAEKASSEIKYPIKLPRRLSQVLHDAISVVKELGLRYLWADQYCIDQFDVAQKMAEIGMMHSIYEGASLTIIAAAGDSADYGLPGVGSRVRNSQSKLAVGDKTLITTFKDPRNVIRKSTWMGRGWTLQEAKFSRRRLYFTDDQVYFECSGMTCQESISAPLEDLPQEVFSRRLFSKELAGGIFSDDVEEAYLENVSLYTVRNLTSGGDALNAFRGILKAFETTQPPLYHCWAVPSLETSGAGPSPERYFAHSLLWEFPTNVTRRHEFPSWSWLGWTGNPHFQKTIDVSKGRESKGNQRGRDKSKYDQDTRKCPPELDIKVWIGRKDGALLRLQTVQDAAKVTNELDQLSTVLRIEAVVLPFRLSRPSEYDGAGGIGKQQPSFPQGKMDMLQNLAWKEYAKWKKKTQQHEPATTDDAGPYTDCDCKVGFVVPDPDRVNASDPGGRRVLPGLDITHMQFLLKSEDNNTCLVHAPSDAQELYLVLVGFHPDDGVTIYHGNRVENFIARKMESVVNRYARNFKVNMNFLLVRARSSSENKMERVGFLRVFDEDGYIWRKMMGDYRRTIELG